ncbi:conserved protein of unknown function (plasmid) [Cupriavidus taiwanensis]|uniref:Uncharacterized protein n=1 Tax=Cupriavidus taiwanensis TaxID=164546 RepID=A0A375IRB8_9BURK|nr:conserved protein of unknown function [Cupriavidus taiwanensis]
MARTLSRLLGKCPNVLYVSSGALLYEQVLALHMEGVVGKRRGSSYIGGSSPDRIKIKRPGATPAERFNRREM